MGPTRPGTKQQGLGSLQKNPKLDRVNSSKPVKPASAPVQLPHNPPVNKPQLLQLQIVLKFLDAVWNQTRKAYQIPTAIYLIWQINFFPQIWNNVVGKRLLF